MKSTETNKTKSDKTVIKSDISDLSDTGYGTNELSVYISEQIGIDISGKRLRKYLRKLIPAPESGYRNYRFRTLSNSVTDAVIGLIESDERKRTERKAVSEKRRAERKNRQAEFIDDKFTVDKSESKKPKRKKLAKN